MFLEVLKILSLSCSATVTEVTFREIIFSSLLFEKLGEFC